MHGCDGEGIAGVTVDIKSTIALHMLADIIPDRLFKTSHWEQTIDYVQVEATQNSHVWIVWSTTECDKGDEMDQARNTLEIHLP